MADDWLKQIDPKDATLRQYLDARAGTNEHMKRLAAQGLQLNVIGTRLSCLIDAILEPEDRLTFELFYQSRLAEQLVEVEEQAMAARTRAALTSGIGPRQPAQRPKLIIKK